MYKYILLLFIILGCTNNSLNGDDQIYLKTTKEYIQITAKLKLTEVEATKLLVKFLQEKNNTQKVLTGEHQLIIDDHYVFCFQGKRASSQYNINGYYVNGITGEIQKVIGKQPLTYSYQKRKWGKIIESIARQ
jgi:hypothetical protein